VIVAAPRGEKTCAGRSENDEHVLNGVISGSKGAVVKVWDEEGAKGMQG